MNELYAAPSRRMIVEAAATATVADQLVNCLAARHRSRMLGTSHSHLVASIEFSYEKCEGSYCLPLDGCLAAVAGSFQLKPAASQRTFRCRIVAQPFRADLLFL